MNITDYIRKKIDRFPKDYIFTYGDFMGDVSNKQAVAKALNRMVLSGKIKRISKGRFYKPEITPFGILEPGIKQVVKDLLEKNGKNIGYLTGESVFNKFGLTTQISNNIQIGTNNIRSKLKRDKYYISFLKQKNSITEMNIEFLQILDCIRLIKKIPDSNILNSFEIIKELIMKYSEDQLNKLIYLSLKYPPSTRALLGLMLFKSDDKCFTKKLYNSLNPITIYKYPEIAKKYKNSNYWRII